MGSYRGVDVPKGIEIEGSDYWNGWRDGVRDAQDAGLRTTSDPSTLKITGWTKAAVRAFAHVVEDDPDTAVRIIGDMSPKDRAVLSFWLNELSGIVDAAETARTVDRDTRTRALVRGEDI